MKSLLLGSLAVALFPGLLNAGSILYSVTKLPELGSCCGTYATAINNAGQITGQSDGYGFIYSNGVMTPIVSGGEGLAINYFGQIVGETGTGNTGFIYSGGSLSTLSGPGYAINDAGVVSGYAIESGVGPSGSTAVAAFFEDGIPVFAPPSALLPQAYAAVFSGISDADQFVGYAYGGEAFLYSGGQYTLLGSSCGPYPTISAGGEVAVTLCDGQAYSYSNGVLTALGTLGAASEVLGINDSGIAVGDSTYNVGLGEAVIFQNGVATTLNSLIDPSLGLNLSGAEGINDSGQIIASDEYGTGAGAYLLTPIGSTDTPEPAPALLLLIGMTALVLGRRGNFPLTIR